MPQKTSPFTEVKYGWTYGESGWNTGMDEDLLKFSFFLDSNIDGVVSTLPILEEGKAYFLTTDNRLYYVVEGIAYSSPTPKWKVLKIRGSGDWIQFNGTSVESVSNPVQTQLSLDSKAPINSPTFTGTVSGISKSMVGLPNVDNTSDVSKPISTLTQNALDTKVNVLDLTSTTNASLGSALVGYRGRVVRDKLDDFLSLLDFAGGAPNTIADWTPVLIAALGVSKNIRIPSGKFTFLTPFSYTFLPASTGPSDNKNNYQSINIVGAGADNTICYFPSTAGFEFVMQSFQHTLHIHDLTISTGTTNAGTALYLRNRFAFFGSYTAQHDITGVTFRGDDGYGAVNYWTKCVELFNITAINFDRNSFYGPLLGSTANTYGRGVEISSSTTPGIATSTEPGCGTSYNFTNNNFVFLGRALHIGTLVQAFKIGTGNAILNGFDGVYVAPGGLDVRQVCITGTEISVYGNAIEFQTACSATNIVGNYIAIASGKNGVVLATDTGAMNSGGTTIVGNTFVPLGAGASDGIYVNTTYAPVTITGNTFLGLTRGIELTATSQQVKVQGNQYMNCTQNLLNSGGNANDVGLDENVAWSTYTPTLSSGSGTFTAASATGKYRRVGKTVFISVSITITTNGTAATNIQVTVPSGLNFKSTQALTGRENNVTGVLASVVGSTNTIYITKYDGTYLGGNGYSINVAGEYEIN